MTSVKRWLLPDGVEDILPAEAHRLELLRRDLLDLYKSWGYELVIPPLIEFLDSLLVGTSQDLDIHTFKITDQLSGKMMGIRADITPQAARIDAHSLNREGVVRLCYADSTLHTKPRGIMTSRVPIRIGAELYGHSGVAADIELICMMNESLLRAGIEDVHIVLGHVGVFRSLLEGAQLDPSVERQLFEAVQRKAYDEIDQLLVSAVADVNLRQQLQELSRLSGDETVLERARLVFADAPSTVVDELDELIEIAEGAKRRLGAISLGFDLCELRGYEYHTGIVFAAYTPAYGRAVAKGGRYDDNGEAFGQARPASGFDSDLKTLAKLSQREFTLASGILAPDTDESALMTVVEELRKSGEIVVTSLGDGEADEAEMLALRCDRRLVKQDGSWKVV